jgi:hypothetical protein
MDAVSLDTSPRKHVTPSRSQAPDDAGDAKDSDGGPFFDSHSETADEDEYGGCAAKAVSDLAHSIEEAHCSTPNPRTEQRDISWALGLFGRTLSARDFLKQLHSSTVQRRRDRHFASTARTPRRLLLSIPKA